MDKINSRYCSVSETNVKNIRSENKNRNGGSSLHTSGKRRTQKPEKLSDRQF
jgi:hypothetical protein